MESRKRYLFKNTILFTLNSFGTRLINFFLVPLYTIAFTKAEYGTVDLVSTIITVVVPIVTMNIGEAVMRFSLDKDVRRNDVVSVGLLFTALSFLLSTCVLFILSLFPEIHVNGWIIYACCISLGLYQTLSCNLRGQEKLLDYAVGNIFCTLVMALLNILFLVVLKIGINGYFYAQIAAYLSAGVFCAVKGRVCAALKCFHLDGALMRSMVKYAIVLVPNSFMWWIMNSSDHIMVTSMIGVAANGIYAVSYKIPSILSALSTVFNQAWNYSAIRERESVDGEIYSNGMYRGLACFMLIVTAGLLCVMKPFLKIYVQAEYYEAWMYTPYLLVGNFFLTLATFLSSQYTVNKDSRGFLCSGTVGAAMNVLLNWLLIPKMGIHGAALATCASYMAVFLYRVVDTRKYMKIHVFKPLYVAGYLMLIAMACTMAVPGALGQALMACELLAMLVLNHRFVRSCVAAVRDFLRRFRRK